MEIAFIGLGAMGGPMAANLLKAGHKVTVHNRTREREEPLAAQGAKRAASPGEAAGGAEVILLCVSDTPDVEQVLFGQDGVAEGAEPGTVVADMSTISPAATKSFAVALAEKGIMMVDAPISGGSEGAVKGTLAIMVGGEPANVEKVMPAFEAMGKSITHVGPIGAGQMTKAINQVILAGYYFSTGEGIALGLKAGLDVKKVVQAIGGGAAASWVLANRSDNMIDNTYPLGFRVRLHQKDLRIALETAAELNVSLPVAGIVAQYENGLLANGYGDEDVSALARIVRESAGLK
jgi:3-hydroxyisobutyrate dehydrogenase